MNLYKAGFSLEAIASFFYYIDRTLFYFLNHVFVNPVLDRLMPIITEEDNWRIPILLLWLSLMTFGGKKGRITALLVLFIVALSDQLVNFVIKPWVGRVRPCFILENVRCLIDQPRSPSFPSSHAANMAAMATLFSYRYRRYTALFVFIAFLVSFSRIYVGVHYPSDMLAGWCVGIVCAVFVLFSGKKIGSRIQTHIENSDEKAIWKDQN